MKVTIEIDDAKLAKMARYRKYFGTPEETPENMLVRLVDEEIESIDGDIAFYEPPSDAS